MTMPRNGLPPHCSWETDRHDKRQVRFRWRKISRYITATLGSPEFWAAHAKMVDEAKGGQTDNTIGADRSPPHSLGALIKAYLATPSFKNLAAETQRTRRNILENFAKRHGDKPLYYIAARTGERIMMLKRAGMQKIVNEKAETPFAQRNFLNTVRVMFEWAVSEGRVSDNPTLGVKRQKIKSKGYHTATETEIARMEAQHAIGTRERLAFALLLYTGVRRTDVIALGPANIDGDVIVLDQHKTDGTEEAHLEIPVHPTLKAIIAATPTVGIKTFLVTKRGTPFDAPSFGNWFRKLCDEANCPKLSAHTMRKATARRLADIGCSAPQIASITGHATLAMVQKYIEAADRKRMGREAMAKLVEGGW
jgi:integrase